MRVAPIGFAVASFAIALLTVPPIGAQDDGVKQVSGASVHAFEMKRIDGVPQKLSEYRGKLLLIVNVASECGFTGQYEGLQRLHEKYGARGFTVLGFPSNDFGKQEPGTDPEILKFCSDRYKVTFPLFSKVAVLGPNAVPLYRYLQEESAKKTAVKWNFQKFLVDPDGYVITAFGPKIQPEDPKVIAAIEDALSRFEVTSRPTGENSGVRLAIGAFEARSLLGEPLAAPPLAPEKRAEREKLLDEARAMQPADSADRAVLVGRRLANLGRYQDSIAEFTQGIARHPADARLWRHRGHRYVNTRRFDLAKADLERAAGLIAGKPDEIEPDVQPNPKSGPVNSLHASVWYHLGLAFYLTGDFANAEKSWREGLKIADNPDKICSTSYWLYLALRRLGKHDEARRLLDPIQADWKLVESGSYQKLLLVFRGDLKADDVLEAARKDPEPVPFPTIGYGLCAWFSFNGDEARAEALRREIVKGPMWPAFGFIAAEVELAKSGAATKGNPDSRPPR